MNCNVIKDLLPLYSEGLCSDETKAIIEEHLSECEDCRRLADMPVEQVIPVDIPEEKSAMKKVSRKIRRSKLAVFLIGAALAAVIGCIGYLSYGQIVKRYDSPSFDTVFQNMEVRSLIRTLEKDPEKFAEQLSTGDSQYNVYLNWSKINYDEMQRKDIENFVNCYKAAYGDTGIFKIKLRSSYGADTEEPSEKSDFIVTDAYVTLDDGRELLMYFYKDQHLKYYCRVSGGASGNAEKEMQNSLNYISQKQDPGFDWIFEIMKKNRTVSELDSSSMTYWLKGDSEKLLEGMNSFYEKGYEVTEGYMSDLFYDPDREMLYTLLTIDAKDSSGTALLRTKVYRDHNGYYAPDPADAEVYRSGCTDGLVSALEHYFG